MRITIFEDRKPTNESYELAAVNGNSLESLVQSIGPERAKLYIENGVKAAFMSAYNGQINKDKTPAQITTWAETWVPTASSRVRKTPEEKVADFAKKLGVSVADLNKMTSAAVKK